MAPNNNYDHIDQYTTTDAGYAFGAPEVICQTMANLSRLYDARLKSAPKAELELIRLMMVDLDQGLDKLRRDGSTELHGSRFARHVLREVERA